MYKFKHAFYFMVMACELEDHVSAKGKIPVSTLLMAT